MPPKESSTRKMVKNKIKPIQPDPQEVAALRRKLRELISRMKSDYDKWLKPLVTKMSEEQKEELDQIQEEAKGLLASTDAVEYLTAFEASRKLKMLKSSIVRACQMNDIPGAILDSDNEWLIPATSVEEYGIKIGRIDPRDQLIDLFNSRLDSLAKKYNDLIWQYQSMSEKFTEQMFQKAKKKFLSQFDKDIGVDVLKRLSERGLREAFDQQVAINVDLIKSIPQKYFADIRSMVTKSTTGGFHYEGGLQKAIMDLTGATRNRAVLIARDQSMKAVSTFTQLRFVNLGSKKYIWHNSKDRRVAGNPNGLYPTADPKSKFHGNHWVREGKVFDWSNPPPDGNPGIAINCRCWAEPIFEEG